jgi:hypothetical protein
VALWILAHPARPAPSPQVTADPSKFLSTLAKGASSEVLKSFADGCLIVPVASLATHKNKAVAESALVYVAAVAGAAAGAAAAAAATHAPPPATTTTH